MEDKKMVVMMVVVGILLVASAFQSVELMNLSSSLKGVSAEAQVNQYAAPSSGSSSGSGQNLQKNLAGLETMVGGC